MKKHAELSPSSAERWLQCPASVRMSATVPEGKESVYAREGTAAHALAELMARHKLLGLSTRKFRSELGKWRKEFANVITDEEEMVGHATMYVEYLHHCMEGHDEAHLLLEQKLPTGLPNCWGTSDAVVVSPSVIEIVDYKYGMGVLVEAFHNPQLRLYGIGALEAFGDLLGEVEKVRMTVYQPRIHHVSTEELSAEVLRDWRDSLLPIAEQALAPDAPFGPSEVACRWCPASGNCRAQVDHFAHLDFGAEVDTLDDQELARILTQIPHIEQWCAAVKDYALDRVYSKNQPIPGFKVVMSGGRRSIVDPEGALEALQLIGYTLDQVATTKIRGIGELEKLLRSDFDAAVGPFVKKGEGSPSLVPEDDKRPAINPESQAALDFQGQDLMGDLEESLGMPRGGTNG